MQSRQTALHMACNNGHVEVAETLITHGVTIDEKDRVSPCTVMIKLKHIRAKLGVVTKPKSIASTHVQMHPRNVIRA